MGFKKDCRYFMYKYYNGSKIPSKSMAQCMRGDFPALIGDYYCEICRLYPVEQKLAEIEGIMDQVEIDGCKPLTESDCKCSISIESVNFTSKVLVDIKKILESKNVN